MRFLPGHDLIGEELIKIASTAQMLSCFTINIKNSRIRDFKQRDWILNRQILRNCQVELMRWLCLIKLEKSPTKRLLLPMKNILVKN